MRFISNPLSKENIAFGLIMESNGKIMFRFSEEKLDFIYKLSPLNLKLIKFSISKIEESLKKPVDNDEKLIAVDEIFNLKYLDRLSSYNNGIIQFDKPQSINQMYDNEKFESFFNKYIAINVQKENALLNIITQFQNKISKSLYEPLKSQIDIDTTIKKESIPHLFFNYHLDGIGVNGSIYSIKAIDLNSNKALSQVQKNISEYESFNIRVDSFAKTRDINGESKHYLVVDPYIGSKLSYLDLYNIISKQSDINSYELIGTNELDKIVKLIKKRKAKKFTEEFQLL